MGVYSIKPKFQKFLKPLERLFVRYKVHPTTINLFAFFLSVIGGVCLYYSGEYILLLLYVPFMSFFRTALNALDGMIARDLDIKHQDFGEVLNEFFDRLSDIVIFFSLSLAPYTNYLLGSSVLILILLNSYLSIVSKAAKGRRQYGGFMGKADRMIYLSIMSILVLITKDFVWGNYLFWFLGIGTIITMIQRFISIKKELYDHGNHLKSS